MKKLEYRNQKAGIINNDVLAFLFSITKDQEAFNVAIKRVLDNGYSPENNPAIVFSTIENGEFIEPLIT